MAFLTLTVDINDTSPDGITTFNSIQAAINAASAGDTIVVGAGTYSENISVTEAVTIRGANTGLAGSDTTRGAETLLTGRITLASDSVTIDGLAFNTTAAAIRGGASGTENYSDITISNNAFLGLVTNATQFITNGFGTGGAASGATNWLITANFFDGATGTDQAVMRLQNIDGLTVSDNVIRHDDPAAAGRRGVQLATVENVTFSGNDISLGLVDPTNNTAGEFAAARYGLQISMDFGPSSEITVSGNIFDGGYDGVITLGNGFLTNLEIDDNTFTNSVFGVRTQAGSSPPLNNNPSVGAIDGLVITNNTFDGQEDLLGAVRITGADPHSGVVITDNTFVGDETNIVFGAVAVNGAMVLQGSDNNDTFISGSGNDSIDGAGGTDTINMVNAGTGGAFVDLNAGLAFSTATGIDSLTSIENVRGSAGNDGLYGDAGDNTFFATAGNDVIDGRGGSDTYDASAATGPVRVNLATGTANGTGIDTDTLIRIENVKTGSGDDAVTGSSADNTISTGAGDDIITLVGGNDVVDGGAGVDTLVIAGNFADSMLDALGGTVSGAGRSATFENIERIQFDDRKVFIVRVGDDIQATVIEASAGDLIVLDEGTHVLPAQLTLNKAIEIVGAGEGLTTLQTAATSWGVLVGWPMTCASPILRSMRRPRRSMASRCKGPTRPLTP